MITNRSVYRMILLSALVIGTEVRDAAATIPPRYHVTDLASLGGGYSVALGINASGQVTGHSHTAESFTNAFLWTPSIPNGTTGAMHDLGRLGGQISAGTSINAGGQVAGFSNTNGDPGGAFLWTPTTPGGASGTMVGLGTLGGSYSQSNGINVGGQITGYSNITGDTADHAFLWTRTTSGGTSDAMHDLGTLGGDFSVGNGINERGQVTGTSATMDYADAHAFLWTPTIPGGTIGSMLDLGTLGGPESIGSAINASGQVTGSSLTVDYVPHAFLWTPTAPGGTSGSMLDLGTMAGASNSSIAHGINSSGHVVGQSEVVVNDISRSHAFMYSTGRGMVDLNSLIDPRSGWELHDAFAVNDAGQIVGVGNHGAFLLTPLPQRYQIAAGDFHFDNGQSWTITHGEISIQFFDVLVSEEGYQRGVYGVTALSLTAVDALGASHTITTVPDGMNLQGVQDPFVPEFVHDIGLVNVYPEGFLDMIVYDLSIDGEPVDPLDFIGGPAFVGSAWLGSFPVPTNFAISMLANLGSQNLRGEVTLVAELVPEPATMILHALATIALTLAFGPRIRKLSLVHLRLVAVATVMIVAAGPVRAATFSASSVAELISAINATNQDVDPDSINLAPGVTFTLTTPENETNGPTGLPTIAAGRELSIFGNSAVIERSAAMETPTFRLFDVAAGAALRLENLTLQGGHLYGEQVLTVEASAKGGAIFNQGDLALQNVTVQDNMAVGLIGYYARGYSAAGGGLYSSGSLTMQGGTVQNNLAQGGLGGVAFVGVDGATPGGPGGHGWGGGLYIADGTATLNDVIFSANFVQGGAGGRGATVQNHGTRISTPGGRGGDGSGGGLFVADGTITLYDATVTNNVAAAGAGGTGGPGPPPGAHGAAGLARGGGLFIEDESTTRLDEFTFTHVTDNTPSNFYGPVEILPNQVPGDYNNDGRVNAGDYVRWRNHLGDADESAIHHNGDGGDVSLADYTWWKEHYGTPGTGGLAQSQIANIPEPATAFLAIVGLACLLATSRKRPSG